MTVVIVVAGIACRSINVGFSGDFGGSIAISGVDSRSIVVDCGCGGGCGVGRVSKVRASSRVGRGRLSASSSLLSSKGVKV